MNHTIRIISPFLIPVLLLTICGPYAMARNHEAGSMTASMHYKRSQAETAKTPDTRNVPDTRSNQDNTHEVYNKDGVSQQAVQEALSYYPLQTGDEWQYHYRQSSTTNSDSGYVDVSVSGDTLMSNHHRYQIVTYHYYKQGDSSGIFTSDTVKYHYERIDSATANVYQATSQGEILIDSLLIQKGEGIMTGLGLVTCYDTTNWKTFGNIRHVKKLLLVTPVSQGRYYTLVNDIGIVSSVYHSYEEGIIRHDTLTYTKIDGKEYGNYVDTPTPIQKTPLPNLPSSLKLYQNYPNPFNPTTTISYQLAKSSHVRLAIWNILGRRVATLVNATQQKGTHQITFDASQLASGIYFYRLQANGKVFVKKMMVMK